MKKFNLSQEVKDIAMATIGLAFAFGWGYRSGAGGIVAGMALALFSVGIGFIGHELAHRYMARKFGAEAHFKLWPAGLIGAILLSLVTNGSFIFAAPGAVYIKPRAYDRWYKLDRKIELEENGIISIAGPATNLLLAAIFIGLGSLTGLGLFNFAASVNAFLALFNSIPIGPLDGKKILAWDVKGWILLIVISVATLYLI